MHNVTTTLSTWDLKRCIEEMSDQDRREMHEAARTGDEETAKALLREAADRYARSSSR